MKQGARTYTAHAGAGILERKEGLCPQAPPRYCELALCDAASADHIQLTVDQIEHLGGVLGRRSDTDRQRAHFLVVNPVGPNGVGKAALLTHLLEEPAGDPPTENVVQQGHGPSFVVMT